MLRNFNDYVIIDVFFTTQKAMVGRESLGRKVFLSLDGVLESLRHVGNDHVNQCGDPKYKMLYKISNKKWFLVVLLYMVNITIYGLCYTRILRSV